jgi:hypothetical protein
MNALVFKEDFVTNIVIVVMKNAKLGDKDAIAKEIANQINVIALIKD